MLLVWLAVSIAAAQQATTAVSCTKVASPNGSDSNSGSPSSPFRTAQALLSNLSAGQVGCLTSGATFVQDVARVNVSGTSGAPITITSTGSSPATLKGRLYIPSGANYITVTNLILDGRNNSQLPSPAVNGDHAVFRYDEITNYHTSICFQLGNPGWGSPHGTVIDSSRVHDCGRLPSNNTEHGLYVETAYSTQITNNYIYKNADRGVQLYPNAQGTQVMYNVIDSNGEGVIFSGDGSSTSANNYVAHNVISNSKNRYNVESWWPGQTGSGNIVELNCLWHGAQGDVQTPKGFVSRNNTTAHPSFVSLSGADYRLSSGSSCAGMGPQTSQVGTGVAATSPLPLPPPLAPTPPAPSPPAPTPPPTTPPPTTTGTFKVSAPLSGTLSGSVSWIATVSGISTSSVSSVVFSIDGKALTTEHHSPYVFNGDGKQLDTHTLSNGTHTFLVTVTSTSGQTATSSFQSTVANGSPSSGGTSTSGTSPTRWRDR